jgi:hypothetical protein
MAENQDDEIGIETLELYGIIVQHQVNDLAHTNEILLAMEKRQTEFYAQALVDLFMWVEAAIPWQLRPIGIQKALDGVEWKVGEAERHLGIYGGVSGQGAM